MKAQLDIKKDKTEVRIRIVAECHPISGPTQAEITRFAALLCALEGYTREAYGVPNAAKIMHYADAKAELDLLATLGITVERGIAYDRILTEEEILLTLGG